MTTPRQIEADVRHSESKESISELSATKLAVRPTKTSTVNEYESDIDADELLPEYLEAKTKLFHLQPSKVSLLAIHQRGAGTDYGKRDKDSQVVHDPEVA